MIQSGDSDELQALFDSIVGAATLAAEEEPASGDNPDLQALFDTVAEQYQREVGPSSSQSEIGSDGMTNEQRDELYRRVGKVAGQLHDALKELGCDSVVAEAAQAVPDAKERLHFIAQKTEEAAIKVLNAAEIAGPLQKELENRAAALREQWDRLFANQLSAQEFKELARQTHGFLALVQENAHLTSEQLMAIVMAQDFQDLTGQVIKKVIEIVGRIETELLAILIEAMPEEVKRQKGAAGEEPLLNGPQIKAGEGVLSSQAEVDDLIFLPGFSTAEKISDVSGRGMGMDVVRTNITKLNGTIDVHSEVGRGTTFIISLPLTLAILPVLLVRLGEQPFAVPLSLVREILPIHLEDIREVGGRSTLVVRGEVLPVLPLANLLNWPLERALHYGVLMQMAEFSFILGIDSFAGREDAVIKSLEDFRPKGVAGVTILSNGQIVLILDMKELFETSSGRNGVSKAELLRCAQVAATAAA